MNESTPKTFCYIWDIEAEPGSPKGGDLWIWSMRAGDAEIDWNFRWIPPTPPNHPFRMGARGWFKHEEPVHEVTVLDGFWILETLVTQVQYLGVMGENPSAKFDEVPDALQHPVQRVNWFDARSFFAEMTKQVNNGLKGQWSIDFPTEAQWEYACRAGTETEYHSGDGEEALFRVGWCIHNGKMRTHPVREKEKNAWNLHDMHGNVWEWCWDKLDKKTYQNNLAQNKDAAEREAYDDKDKEIHRVLRGGGFWSPVRDCRSAFRYGQPPMTRLEDAGIRPCILSLKKKRNQSRNSSYTIIEGDLFKRDDELSWFVNAIRNFRNSEECKALGDWTLYLYKYGKEDLIERFEKSFPGHRNIEEYVKNALEKLDDPNNGIPDGRHHYRDTENAKPEIFCWPDEKSDEFSSLSAICLWSFEDLKVITYLPPLLRTLDLRNARNLIELPPLPETIETLDLTGCKSLTKLPIQFLPNLKYLYLGGCKMLTSQVLDEFLHKAVPLSVIRELELFDCPGVKKLPASWIQCKNLRHLDVSGCNELICIHEFKKTNTLEHLNLQRCTGLIKLPELPVDNLRYLCLFGSSTLKHYLETDLNRRDLGERENENVSEYFAFKTMAGRQTEEFPRCKLILLGNGRAGKTTFAKALQWMDLAPEQRANPTEAQIKIKPNENEESTHPIWQCEWKTRLWNAEQKYARINIWDFGGQELFHGTHRTFAATGSLFIIVHSCKPPDLSAKPFNLSDEDWTEYNRQYPLKYWLDYVQDIAPESQVILIYTHWLFQPDGNTSSWPDMSPLSRQLSRMVVGEFKVGSLEREWVSSEMKQAYNAVKTALIEQVEREGIRIEKIRVEVIETARNISKATEEITDTDAIVTWDRWCEILNDLARQFNLRKMTEKFQEALTLSMHRAGELFWARNQAIILLNQKAALNEIYRLLDYKDAHELRREIKNNYGLFYLSDVSEFFQARPNEKLVELLLEFMMQCRICVQIFRPGQSGTKGSPCLALDPSLLRTFSEVKNDITYVFSTTINPSWQVCTHQFRLKKEDEFFSAASFRDLQAWAVQLTEEKMIYWKNGLQFTDWEAEDPLVFRLQWKPNEGNEQSYGGFLETTTWTLIKEHEKNKGDATDPFKLPEMLQRAADLLFTGPHSFSWEHWLSFPHPIEHKARLGKYDVGISVKGIHLKLARKLEKSFQHRGLKTFLYATEQSKNIYQSYNSIRKAKITLLIISHSYLFATEKNKYCLRELTDAILRWAQSKNMKHKDVVIIHVSNKKFVFHENFAARTKAALMAMEKFRQKESKKFNGQGGTANQPINIAQALKQYVEFCKYFTAQVDSLSEVKFSAPANLKEKEIEKITEKIAHLL